MNGKSRVPTRSIFVFALAISASEYVLQRRRHLRTTHRQRRLFDRRQFALLDRTGHRVAQHRAELVGHCAASCCRDIAID